MFGRAMRLVVNTKRLQMNVDRTQATNEPTSTTLRATFRVTQNLKGEPNTAEIKVWNLSRATRAELEQKKIVPVLLEAGHVETGLSGIFNGQMRNATTERDGSALVTSITTGDGETAIGGGRAFVQIPAKATPAAILGAVGQLWQSAGVGLGNLQAAQGLASASFGGPARTLHGSLARVFTDVCTMNGLEWSIQDGNLQVLKIGATVKQSAGAARLSSASGLIGSPSVDTKGILKCKALIQPGLVPGLPVVIDGESVKGAYRIEETEYSGDTWDTEWYAALTCRKWT